MSREDISGGERDYAGVSYWLETCADDLTPRPSLDGSVDADVAILGAGYSGLWTTYYLQRAHPGIRVVIVEAEIAGFGASGRNGAWCTSGFPAGPDLLADRFGRAAAVAVHREMVATVDEVGRVLAEEGIEADYARDGEIALAVGEHQLPALDETMRRHEALGLEGSLRRLDREEARAMLRVEGVAGAVFSEATAVVHPGRLVRGLARAVERRGATIYERSPVTEVVSGGAPRLRTGRGDVRAPVVVLAGESYLTRLRGMRRSLMPVYSLIVLTEAIDEDRLSSIGWTHRAVAHSQALTVDYLSRTADGRILFGGRGAPYHYGSRIADDYDHHLPTHERLRRAVSEWFPDLGDIRCTHAWGGPVAVPRDWTPSVTYDRASGLAGLYGYTGEGVAASNLAARALADVVLDRDSALRELPFVGHSPRRWEPEPLRWLAARYVGRAASRVDEKAKRTGRPPSGRSIVERLLAR